MSALDDSKGFLGALRINGCICHDCVYYLGRAKCRAFPEGIPTRFYRNDEQHTKPVEGDHGLQFKKRE